MKRALLVGCAAVAVLVAVGPDAKAVDQDAINKAIDRGVEYLHSRDVLNSFPGASQPAGATALVGLTLLECDAKPDDADVRRAAETVRKAAVTNHDTYSLALAIIFLDLLGDPADEPLIQSMAVRLMGGQAGGGWTYVCPDPSESEVRRLTDAVEHPDKKLTTERPKDPDGKPVKLTVKDLPKELQDQVVRLNAAPVADSPMGVPLTADNSNTQFAALGLWVARRHGIPVDKSLARLDLRFRTTQNSDGGWSYIAMPNPIGGAGIPPATGGVMSASSATMTCAGLLGLAVARGPKAEVAAENGKTPDLSADLNLRKGLAALGTAVGAPVGKDGVGGKSFYYFWSLERVGVILDQEKIGGHDWYAWGSDILVTYQGADGSWQGEYSAPVDTCFALLFLKRANVARDLTAALKGKTAELGTVTLKSGGVGGDSLKGVEPPKNKKPEDGSLTLVKPPADETEGARMARELAQAPAERRDELVQKYREGKGVTFTEALAGAIPQLNGEDKRKARDALAERLTRMKADTLARYFQDQDAEIRRAAALAAAMKEAKSLIPDLIPLLSDAEPAVAHAAHAALKDLTGEKLGPTEDEWKAWWKNRDK